MRRRTVLVVALAMVGSLLASNSASAHRSPGNCQVNGIDLVLYESATIVRPGDTMTFRVGVQNNNTLFGVPCDITHAHIKFRLPTSTGRYNPAAPAIDVAVNQSFPSMAGPRQLGRDYTWVVNVADPRAFTGAAQASIEGKLHVTAADPDFAAIVKDISFTITNPSLTIDKVGSITSGQAPQNVTYTYVVTNTSQTVVPMNRVGVRDDLCANPTYVSGDNGDRLLSNGEKWTFTCSALHQDPGVYTNTATACAISTVDGREVCSPPDTWTVTLTPPPPPPPAPQVDVKPTTAAQGPCTLSTPKSLRVRAKQLNTIRVRVRNVDAGSRVTIKLPGTKKTVSAKTDENGRATLRVRPRKSGRATIRVAECSEVERLTVRPARRTVAQRNPRVTG